eukprot:Rmarinus@m.17815
MEGPGYGLEATLETVLLENQKWKSVLGFDDAEAAFNELDLLRKQLRQVQRNLAEHKKRETMLMMRLTAKEEQIRNLRSHLSDIHESMRPRFGVSKSVLLDPAVNMEVMRLKNELATTEKKLKLSNEQLETAKFTIHSAKCKQLTSRLREVLNENKEMASESEGLKKNVVGGKAEASKCGRESKNGNRHLGGGEEPA